ncbi:NAD-dependent DNA ligase LigA [Flavilitoribacter nigricans]|uniref:DNA ligase n=1 Tax=Flavilitoribacter nigricans (strain ATCC 23147 / DSM 23189 / NBRC 102662 / NCIMB 1420 / SS-2) TaxID=1122177 RepID=A0A2D0N6G3_FLAN2|nr:NAD-dependent DNA ligase LigA [Flavilitoribacter nigricans]PHN03373.1 DNA ligase (NAD(+)) LigA [Flavilitoribacter nigricans DSM 23189 = NBRC 102662]
MYAQAEQKRLYEQSKQYLDGESAVHQQSDDLKVENLRQLIIYHEWRYYLLNDPVVSDYEYDLLYKQLEAIEAEHPEMITPDSPTQRVSADLTADFPSVEHLTPMLSLANSYNAEDLNEFDQQIKRFLNLPEDEDILYAVEPKFDGGSIALVYENDLLVRAATRGNGTLGEEMTANARAIRSIPLSAKFSKYQLGKVELRGEVIIRKDVFTKMNKARGEAGLTLFANARNTATGGLRMKDPKEVAQRGLEAFIYTLGYGTDAEGNNQLDRFDTHYESLDMLADLGFKVPKDGDERKLCKNIGEVVAFCKSWEARREGYPYEIDGMVVKVNDRILQERTGSTSHHPRWAIAYKFAAKQATSRLLKVDYQVGKIGTITPVAKVEPVALAGVTISSISLHNEDFIKEKDLHLGDTVLIERAGDVIPYIVKAMPELRDGSETPIEFPRFCPINDTDQPVELERTEGEAAWRCPNCVCGAQDLQRIIFHVSKPAMDIDGFGKQIVERFYDQGWIRTMADVYRLDYEQIAQLEGFGERSAENLRQAIDQAKQNPIYRLLHSLSIHHLGKKVSKLLAAEIDHVLDLQEWTEENYTHIKDVGPKVAQNVMAYFSVPRNIEILREMESLGVNLSQTEDDQPKAAVSEGPFVGKTILFTGTLQNMSRKEAQQKAEAAGAKNISAVSGNLDILVVGEKAGSKLKKAQALGTVEIMTEEEFLARV